MPTIRQFLRRLADVVITDVQDGDAIVWDETTSKFINSPVEGGGGGAVSSVFGRTGTVTAQSGDYTPDQVGAQPADSDLSAIAALDSSTAGALVTDGSGWIRKTYAQLKTALSLTKSDVGLGNVDNTADTAKPVSTAQQTALDAKVTANAGITGATKTKVTYDTKGLVTAGADATTADIADSTDKRYITDAQRTVVGNTSGTNTGDQTSVSGNAGTATKLATARSIDGQAFDGSADITVIAPGTHAATGKTTPVDADELPIVDSASSNVLKKLTWANVKATLKTYFDTLYQAAGATAGGDLTGTYPNPTIGSGKVTEAKLSIADNTTANVSTSAHGFAPKAPNDASKFLDGTGAYSTPSSSGGGLAVYGDGSDGAATFDGSTTYNAFSSLAGSTYTLSRDVFLSAGTVNNGVSIVTNGFRFFCSGTLTNNGTIQWNGNAGAAGGTAGAALSNSSNSSINIGSGAAAPGTAGGAGGTTTGGNGVNGTTAGNLGGTGGVGGSGTSGSGGSAGTLTAAVSKQVPPRAIPFAIFTDWYSSGNTLGAIQGGSGGGGGGGDGTAGAGGGGGGGIVGIYVKTFSGTGAIQARGGNGGTPSAGNRGGGGGGGGGLVIVISSSVSSGAISGQTIDANGGTKGSPHGTGTDNATNGSNGTVILIPN